MLSQPEQVIFLRERLFRLPLDRFRPLGDPTRHLAALATLVSRAKDEDVSPAQYRAWAEARRAAATTEEERDEAEGQLELAAFYEAHQRAPRRGRARRLRRPDPPHPRPPARAPVRPRAAAGAVPLRARGRVPGHEPRPARDAQAAGRRDGQPHRGGRRRPGHLPLAGGGGGQPPRLPPALPGGPRGGARGELPLHADDPRHRGPARLATTTPTGWRRSRGSTSACAPRGRTGRRSATCTSTRSPPRPTAWRRWSRSGSGPGSRPRDFALLVRSNADADPFLRALNVKGLPHRFSGSRGLYAREEVRLLVSFLRALANPDDSVSALLPRRVRGLRACPRRDLLRLNHYARRKTRPLLEVLRGLPENEDLASVSGRTREAASRLVADLERAAAEVPRRRTGEVLYGFLQWSGVLGRLAQGGLGRGRGEGQEHRPLLRDGEGVRRRGRARPRARLRGPPRPAARGGGRPGGGGGRSRRGRGARPDRPQGQGPRVPPRLPRGLRRVEVPAPAPGRPPALPRGAPEGGARRGRGLPPARGAAALLRRHDAGPRRAGAHLGDRLRHLARAQGLALRGRGARPAVAPAGVTEDLPARVARPERARLPIPRPPPSGRSRRTSCCGSPTARSTTTRPARSSTATSTSCGCPC